MIKLNATDILRVLSGKGAEGIFRRCFSIGEFRPRRKVGSSLKSVGVSALFIMNILYFSHFFAHVSSCIRIKEGVHKALH